MKLPINCCCDAGRLLGFVEVADDVKPDDEISFSVVGGTLRLPVGQVHVMGNVAYMAIKSNDTPMEVLREIPGFEESTIQLNGSRSSRSLTYIIARNQELIARSIANPVTLHRQEEIVERLERVAERLGMEL